MTDTERAVDDASHAPRAPRARERNGGKRWPGRRLLVRDELGVLLVLALLVAGIGIPYPDFLDTDNLLSTAHNSVYISLMACGMVFALAMREVDLSVGGGYAMCLVVGALLVREGVPPWLAVPVVLVTGIVLGVFNALVTTLLALPSFIVTLGTLMLYRGVGLALADGKQITDLPLDDSFFGELAAGGAAVLIASTDLAELTEVCDRVLVFVRGRVTGEVSGSRLTERSLAVAMQRPSGG
ncbi:ABC transporter permease subunit [Streptomyces chartreusis]|uniref:ABC transporter permease n=1 Tax=Streptomyces chartreusis TaxID=1969 RepID=UPI0038665A12|nr:hypothetical protein OG938_06920 [Streptomyces chartreusis]